MTKGPRRKRGPRCRNWNCSERFSLKAPGGSPQPSRQRTLNSEQRARLPSPARASAISYRQLITSMQAGLRARCGDPDCRVRLCNSRVIAAPPGAQPGSISETL